MPYDILFYQNLEGPHPGLRHAAKADEVPFQERHIRMSHRRAIGLGKSPRVAQEVDAIFNTQILQNLKQ